MHRCLIASLAVVFGTIVAGGAQVAPNALRATIDHLVYATPDLQVGVERV